MRTNTEILLRGARAEPEAVAQLAVAPTGRAPPYDPVAALSCCTAITSRIRLLTYLTVLPYRDPRFALIRTCWGTDEGMSIPRCSVGGKFSRATRSRLARP
jgi:hypothetical protein